MYEMLLRPHEVSQVPPLQPIGAIAEKLKQSERKREEKRLRQIANAVSRNSEKRKRGSDSDEQGFLEAERKRAKTEDSESCAGPTDIPTVVATQNHELLPSAPSPSIEPTFVPAIIDPQSTTTAKSTIKSSPATMKTVPRSPQVVSKVMPEVRGHTSYLTFARLLPLAAYEGSKELISKPLTSDELGPRDVSTADNHEPIE